MTSPWPAAVLVTAVTLVAAGALVLVITPAGCSVGMRGAPCQTAATNVHPTPSLLPTLIPSPTQAPPSLPAWEWNTGASGAYPPRYSMPSTAGGVAFTCRLPILPSGSQDGGFLALPDRAYVADPHSDVRLPSATTTNSIPRLGLTYSWPTHKWLPVPPSWVEPDGLHYAYTWGLGKGGWLGPDGVFVVDTATGKETDVGSGRRLWVLRVENDGAYAREANWPGLWLVPYRGSTAYEVTGELGTWAGMDHGFVYGYAGYGPGNLIVRMEVKTAKVEPWFKADGAASGILGFDRDGHALIAVGTNRGDPLSLGPNYIWQVNGPGDAYPIAATAAQFVSVLTDAHGVWLATDKQTYLYTGQAIVLVANVGGQIAGECR